MQPIRLMAATVDGENIVTEAQALLEGAASNFRKHGTLLSVAFVFGEVEGKTACVLLSPVQFGLTRFDERERDIFAAIIRGAAKKIHASAVLWISEVWMATYARTDLDASGTSVNASVQRPSERPDRVECLYAMLEHRTQGCTTWQAIISRDAAGAPQLAPWAILAKPDKQGGRFSGMLQFLS